MSKYDDIDFIPDESSCIPIQIMFSGGGADSNAIPAQDLGLALQGLNRTLQIAFYSYESASIILPKPNTTFRSEYRIQRIRPGSVITDGLMWLGENAAIGVVQGTAFAGSVAFWKYKKKLIELLIRYKTNDLTLDQAVDSLENDLEIDNIRHDRNRIKTEDFISELYRSLNQATTPLDTAAATEVLSVKGQDLDIVIDKNGRQAIKKPFAPTGYDPEADPIIEADIKFIRINKQTGNGIMQFSRPTDESQMGHQRFKCDDKSIRSSGNDYTYSFHTDKPLNVVAQRKAYDRSRRGHYWLILRLTEISEPGNLFQ